MNIKPFIKWAGGKSQLLPDIRKNYPEQLGKTINKYCEPFVGGGAVLFDVVSNYNIKEILINDINSELINTYIQVKTNLDYVIDELRAIQDEYWGLEIDLRKDFYYEKRDRFNWMKLNDKNVDDTEKAVLFIFLNKTCFNGLFRVNKKGLFDIIPDIIPLK